jgi:hypothetical protein
MRSRIRVCIRIKVKSRILIRICIKMKSRIRIRLKVRRSEALQTGHRLITYRPYGGNLTMGTDDETVLLMAWSVSF